MISFIKIGVSPTVLHPSTPPDSKVGPPPGLPRDYLNLLGKPQKREDAWVIKWVDYSIRYGLGYLLSNRVCGVYFNDGTKVVLEPRGQYFEYHEKEEKPALYGVEQKVPSYPLTNPPKELEKKVTLLQHFKIYLEHEYKDVLKKATNRLNINRRNHQNWQIIEGRCFLSSRNG